MQNNYRFKLAKIKDGEIHDFTICIKSKDILVRFYYLNTAQLRIYKT